MLARVLLLLVPLSLAGTHLNADLKDDFFAAVRKNDIPAVEALLAKGVDVNSKYRYDQTALFPACDKGYTDMVKVLIAHGAKVDVEDTFYHATPMTWALEHGHNDIVKMLLEKGAPSKEMALMNGVQGNSPELVKIVLDMGGVKPEALSSALGRATKDKHDDLAAMLKAAGAVPPPAADFKVDEDTLKSYAGEYKSETGPALTFKFKDGKVTGGVDGQPPLTLAAFSKTKFTTVEFDGVTFTFTVEDGRVTGLVLVQGGFTAKYKKSEAK
jgi:hypothetical protein